MTTDFQGKFLGIRSKSGWEYCFRTNAHAVVAVVAVTSQGKLLLTEQYRRPVDCAVIEFPAGLVGDGPDAEGIEQAADRELIEETGYQAGHLELLTLGPTSAGLTDEVIHFFKAHDPVKVEAGGGVDGEEIVLHEIPLSEVDHWLDDRQRQGMMVDPKVYAGLYFLRR